VHVLDIERISSSKHQSDIRNKCVSLIRQKQKPKKRDGQISNVATCLSHDAID